MNLTPPASDPQDPKTNLAIAVAPVASVIAQASSLLISPTVNKEFSHSLDSCNTHYLESVAIPHFPPIAEETICLFSIDVRQSPCGSQHWGLPSLALLVVVNKEEARADLSICKVLDRPLLTR